MHVFCICRYALICLWFIKSDLRVSVYIEESRRLFRNVDSVLQRIELGKIYFSISDLISLFLKFVFNECVLSS